MITLVSYPRSGNTFLRMLLLEGHGVASKTYHTEAHGPDAGWEQSAVVKTHLLPHQLPAELLNRKVVYLVRDGRDALVSEAHHRKSIVAPDSDVRQNLMEAIYAAEGSHFGGWSEHVCAWRKRADAIIHFEDLVAHPEKAAARVCELLGIDPEPKAPYPSFESLKHGRPAYGGGQRPDGSLAQHWFRRGKVNAWRDEMPEDAQWMFWHLHGEVMELMGYSRDGKSIPSTTCDSPPARSIRLVIEGNKLLDARTDGIKRYLVEWIRAVEKWPMPDVEVRVLVGDRLIRTQQALELEHPRTRPLWFKASKALLKRAIPLGAWKWLKTRWLKRKAHQSESSDSAAWSSDIIHLPLPQNFHLLPPLKAQLVATVHDLTHVSMPEFHEETNVKLAAEGLDELSNRAARLLAVSASTQRDLKEQGWHSVFIPEGVDRSRFYPIHNEHLKRWVRRVYQLPAAPFFLSISTLEPRKNLNRLIDAFVKWNARAEADHHLVIAGAKGWKWTATDVPAAVKDKVHFIGYVREDHLAALYTISHGFCCVSLYEGFGLPVLEAMACGCPVMVSNRSSLPELVGEHAVLVDPSNSSDIEQGLLHLANRAALGMPDRDSMQASWRYGWLKMWVSYAEWYRRLVQGVEDRTSHQ